MQVLLLVKSLLQGSKKTRVCSAHLCPKKPQESTDHVICKISYFLRSLSVWHASVHRWPHPQQRPFERMANLDSPQAEKQAWNFPLSEFKSEVDAMPMTFCYMKHAGNTWKVAEVQWFPWWTHGKCMVVKEYIHWNMLTFTFPKAIRLESPNLRAYVGVIFGKLIWLGMMYFPYWEAIWEPLLKSNKITKISWGVTWIEETAACWKSWKGRVCHGAVEIWVLESGIPSKRGSHDKVTTAVLPPKQQVFFLYILSEMFPPRFWG